MLEAILGAGFGAILGGLGVFVWAKSQEHAGQLSQQTQTQQLQSHYTAAQTRLEALQAQLETQLPQLQEANASLQSQLQTKIAAEADLKAKLEAKEQVYLEAQTQWQTQLAEQKAQWDKEFKAFLTQTVEATQEKLNRFTLNTTQERSETLTQSLKTLVEPLKLMLEQHNGKLKELSETHLSKVEVLDEHIKALTLEKNQLVSTLKMNKGAGDWGELQLLRILEFSGLRKGVDYVAQETNELGKRPDVKVFLPERGFVYVDAKTLQLGVNDDPTLAIGNAEAMEQKSKKLLASFKQAIKDLSGKEYGRQFMGTPQGSPDFVILFVPMESMLALAIAEDPALWEEALAKNVLLSSPSMLIGLLKTVRYALSQQELSQQVHEVRKLGSDLHDKLMIFTERMSKLKDHLALAQKTFDSAFTAFNGQGGLVSRAKKLEALGCRSNKALPADLAEADLLPETLENTEPLL